jgi:cellulose synthase/poly-beta-1,6-N-acetylglucosamine synthase-like glycosyltransferase
MNFPPNLSLILFSKLTSNPSVGLTFLSVVAIAALICAAIPAVLFAVNVWLFQRPGRGWNKRPLPPISVLIPARNEELSIAEAIRSVLASRGVDLELIVLDDGSTDGTADLVRAAAEEDPRVRLEIAPALPEGWNGKQHACWQLASLATRDVFCFLDADVRVGQEALYRMTSELNYQRANPLGDGAEKALVSGFPRQETGTFLEWLLLPLIHFILLGFLPLAGERWKGWPGFAAGCGQFLMVRREPYFLSGGHSAIRKTMHDGLLLPQLLRRHGFRTSVYDLSRDAVCRMYRGADEVWQGLAKNATEGMASLTRLPVFTALLLFGQVLPGLLAILAWTVQDWAAYRVLLVALCLGYAIRLVSTWRYRQSWQGALLHPLGVGWLLVLEWHALLSKAAGRHATWKQRVYRVG